MQSTNTSVIMAALYECGLDSSFAIQVFSVANSAYGFTESLSERLGLRSLDLSGRLEVNLWEVRNLPKLSCFSFLLPLVQSLLLPLAQGLSHSLCSLPPQKICFTKTNLGLDPPTALSIDAQCQTS